MLKLETITFKYSVIWLHVSPPQVKG